MMKPLLPFLFALILISPSIIGQTIHQVCISEVSNAPCSNNSGIFTPATLTIAVGDQIQFTTYMMGISGGYDGSNHTIQFNGGSPQDVTLPISSNILSQVTTVTTPAFTSSGTYTMECINSSHCFNFADLLEGWSCTAYSVTVSSPTTINEENIKDAISVYPNPTNDFIHIDLSNFQDQQATIYLYDVLGKEVKSMKIYNENLLKLSVKAYVKGLYFVKIVSANYSFAYPVLIN